MKYKVGDRVRIKSLDWYNENKDTFGSVCVGDKKPKFTYGMSKYCDQVLTIDAHSEYEGEYYMVEDDGVYTWTDEMIEGLVEEEVFIKANDIYNEEYSKGEYCHEQSFKWGFQEGYSYSHENDKLEISLKDGYQFKDENGNVINAQKIVLEKKNECPKTYEECAKVLLDRASVRNDFGYKGELLVALQKLLVCRDAYWKIAGEEMGLGKPWKPDWNTSEPKYVIAYTSRGIEKQWETTYCKGFAFPTEEMRDAFYENFKELINECKELL